MSNPVSSADFVIYLDVDGCLHGGGATKHRTPPTIRPELPGHTLFECAPILEGILEPYPDIGIVLSTSWVRVLGFERAKSYLIPSLQARVIGATYHKRYMSKADFEAMPRHAQILQDVARRRPREWIAIDDEFGDDVPDAAWPHFVQTPSELGLACPRAAAALTQLLSSFYRRPKP